MSPGSEYSHLQGLFKNITVLKRGFGLILDILIHPVFKFQAEPYVTFMAFK